MSTKKLPTNSLDTIFVDCIIHYSALTDFLDLTRAIVKLFPPEYMFKKEIADDPFLLEVFKNNMLCDTRVLVNEGIRRGIPHDVIMSNMPAFIKALHSVGCVVELKNDTVLDLHIGNPLLYEINFDTFTSLIRTHNITYTVPLHINQIDINIEITPTYTLYYILLPLQLLDYYITPGILESVIRSIVHQYIQCLIQDIPTLNLFTNAVVYCLSKDVLYKCISILFDLSKIKEVHNGKTKSFS